MPLLITCDWLLNDRVVSSETMPVEVNRIGGLEKSVTLGGMPGVTEDKLTVRLQFDPPLSVQPGE